ncbi:MAG: hypothetical protein SFX73_38590 [Kofleriaceae bacterium]|nr:hypothetical protein [Kofleriaceae bacterium]
MAKTKTPRTGRPPARGETSNVVTVRLTASERELLESAAGDVALSVWIRDTCLRAAKRQK